MMELYGRNILDGLPPNSVLLLSGDGASYSTRYSLASLLYRPLFDLTRFNTAGDPFFNDVACRKELKCAVSLTEAAIKSCI